jgi:DNA replication protein DnaC
LAALLKELHLPTMRQEFAAAARRAEQAGWTFEAYLQGLAERECETRRTSRIERLLRASRLPPDKTLTTFELDRLPLPVLRQLASLREGGFLKRRENVLLFGRSGSGKTHLLCGLAHELVQRGQAIYYRPCSLLVQELLLAKRELKLERLLKQWSRYAAIVIDDLGYVQQSREEMEVLFTLLAERYERGSVLLTSNLPFSKWDQIFKDTLTTAAAIDRLVHHSVILELNLPSYRLETAQKRTPPPPENQ